MIEIPKELTGLDPKSLISVIKTAVGWIKKAAEERLKELIKSGKYLISVSESETRELYSISKGELYKRLEKCLLNHWSLNLIALGIYVSKLNEIDQRQLIERVTAEVHKKYYAKGIRILRMGSTGVIDHIISYLSDLKMKKNYDFREMGSIFDKILDKWQEISFFVKSEDETNKIEEVCVAYIQQKTPLFFIFAYGHAVDHTITTIAKLNNEKKLKGYLFDTKRRIESKKEVYAAIFESIEGQGIDEFA